MDVFFLDYDLNNQRNDIEQMFGSVKGTEFHAIQDTFSMREGVPVRCILLTQLNSGLLAYHLDLFDRYPQIQHWVFCVTSQVGNTVEQTLRRHFAKEMACRDVYCELLFDQTQQLEGLKAVLERPVKSAKKWIVVSNNGALAKNVGKVIQKYLPNWEVTAGTDPDYLYGDIVMPVGMNVSEMGVPCPESETIKKLFWFQVPYSKNASWKRTQLARLKETMNSLGWNLADYDSRTSFSNLLHEQFLLQIRQGEILPAALVSDREFVMWDHYGLPIPQSSWSDEQLVDFLAKNTVFPHMMAQLQKSGE